MSMGEEHLEFRWGNLRKRDRFEDVGVDERIILRWVVVKWYWGGGGGLRVLVLWGFG
jgi:hypothetical protein